MVLTDGTTAPGLNLPQALAASWETALGRKTPAAAQSVPRGAAALAVRDRNDVARDADVVAVQTAVAKPYARLVAEASARQKIGRHRIAA